MARKSLYIVAALAVAAVLIASGCAGKKTYGSTLTGQDLFDPARFSMATYQVLVNQSGDLSPEGFDVLGYPYEKGGNRLASVSFTDNASTRADVWLGNGKTTGLLVTAVNGSAAQINGGTPRLNITVVDRAWNTLDASYRLAGQANVSVPAGRFDGAYMYVGERLIVIGGQPTDTQVAYFLHPDCPVPVMYVVQSGASAAVYQLVSFYGPQDRDSTPERALQTMFDLLDAGRFDAASRYWVEFDPATGKFQRLDKGLYDQFVSDMNGTYGKNGERLNMQYVRASAQEGLLDGYGTAQVAYASPHVDPGTLAVYVSRGNFTMVKINGGWRFLA